MVELAEPLDIEKELQDVLRKVEPDLKDAVKRVSLFKVFILTTEYYSHCRYKLP